MQIIWCCGANNIGTGCTVDLSSPSLISINLFFNCYILVTEVKKNYWVYLIMLNNESSSLTFLHSPRLFNGEENEKFSLLLLHPAIVIRHAFCYSHFACRGDGMPVQVVAICAT